MSSVVEYLASVSADAEEVDLSTFKLIEHFDDAAWTELKRNKTIKRVKLPPSLHTIRRGVFENCKQLKDVTLPSSLRSIEDYAFSDCTELAMMI
jgi:hypothetical protein